MFSSLFSNYELKNEIDKLKRDNITLQTEVNTLKQLYSSLQSEYNGSQHMIYMKLLASKYDYNNNYMNLNKCELYEIPIKELINEGGKEYETAKNITSLIKLSWE